MNLEQLEKIITDIDRLFVIKGYAFHAIKNLSLHNGEFENYCLERFDTKPRRVQMLMNAAAAFYEVQNGEAFDVLKAINLIAFDVEKKKLDYSKSDQIDRIWSKCDQMDRIYPSNEGQARPLTFIANPEDKQACWREVIADGRKITAELVAEYAAKYTNRQPKTIDAKPTYSPPSDKWMQQNPIKQYTPPSQKDAKQYTGMFYDVVESLPEIIGPLPTLLLQNLINECMKLFQKGKPAPTQCRIEDYSLIKRLGGINRKTFVNARDKLIAFKFIEYDTETNRYTVNDPRWTLEGIKADKQQDTVVQTPTEEIDESTLEAELDAVFS